MKIDAAPENDKGLVGSLTPKMHKVLMFIRRTIEAKGVSPSIDEIRIYLGLESKSSVHLTLTELDERGMIRKYPHRARSIDITAKGMSVTMGNENES